jgi:hypothetical protein
MQRYWPGIAPTRSRFVARGHNAHATRWRQRSHHPGFAGSNTARAMALPTRSLMASSSRSATSLRLFNRRKASASDLSTGSAEKLRSGLSRMRGMAPPRCPSYAQSMNTLSGSPTYLTSVDGPSVCSRDCRRAWATGRGGLRPGAIALAHTAGRGRRRVPPGRRRAPRKLTGALLSR